MGVRIIGKGTWLDKVALKVLERDGRLPEKKEVVCVESGLGASGIPHIGSLGDGARAYGIKLALESIRRKTEYIAFSDDLDGLRKIPAGFPDWLKKYLAYPVTSIPDPFSCHESYGAHMSSLLTEALDLCGIKYRFCSATTAYRNGTFTKQIDRILRSASQIGRIIKEELGQEKYEEVLPYFAVCGGCGRIYTTRAYRYLPDEMKVLYRCEGETRIKASPVSGCGFAGEADINKADGKLSWKVEFAARWDAFKVDFEAYGKDIADSVRLNDKICQEILHYPPPLHIRYEMFLDKSGKKISKSTGNVFAPQVWLRYGSPQSLLLLMYKRVVGTRTMSIDDIPQYMAELDTLEDVYFVKRKVEDEKEAAKLRGLFEYIWLLNPPREPSFHVPYRLLVFLCKVAPETSKDNYVYQKLKEYGYRVERVMPDLNARIKYASNWVEDFEAIGKVEVALNPKEKKALKDLAESLPSQKDGDQIQNCIFTVARRNDIDPSDFFKLLYKVLLGYDTGPRLGPYIATLGIEEVTNLLAEAASSK